MSSILMYMSDGLDWHLYLSTSRSIENESFNINYHYAITINVTRTQSKMDIGQRPLYRTKEVLDGSQMSNYLNLF